MTIKVAINGFGRIGRTILRAHYENKKKHDLTIVAINGSGNAADNAHLLKYDSTHGKFNEDVTSKDNCIFINKNKIDILNKKDPKNLPSWKDLGVDLVLECTGRFTSRDDAQLHINAGAKKVLISGPGYSPGTGKEVDATIVYGVNHKILKKNQYTIGYYRRKFYFIVIFTWELRTEFPLQSPLRFLKFWLWSGYSLHEGAFGVKNKGPFSNL